MIKQKKLLVSGLLLTSVIILSSCSSESKSSKKISFELSSDISTLDSTALKDTTSWIVEGNVQEGLTRIDKNGNAALALAKKIDVSKDGLRYNVTLKDNLKWSNGDSLTAKDFVYAWQRAVNPSSESEQEFLLAPIKNATKLNKQPKTTQEELDTLGVKANSDTELTITLEKPTPYFKLELALPITYPLDQKFVEEKGKNYGITSANTVYDGPYKFINSNNWTGTNGKFSIYKNENYWDEENVKTNEIDIQVVKNPNTGVQLYKTKKLDFATLPTTDLVNSNKKQEGFSVIKQSRTDYIEYNQTGEISALTNSKIREALNLATDRKSIVKLALPYSTSSTTITPAGFTKTPSGKDFTEYASQKYEYNVLKARKLFSEGLKELGISKLNLNFEYTSELAPATITANFLQTAWEKNLPGLTVTTKGVPFAQRLSDASTQNFDVMLSGLSGEYGDPSNLLPLFVTNGASNDGKFSNKAFDQAITAANTTDALNNEKRFEDYKIAENALYQKSSINPIDFESTAALVNPNLKNFVTHSSGLPYDFKTAYIYKEK